MPSNPVRCLMRLSRSSNGTFQLSPCSSSNSRTCSARYSFIIAWLAPLLS